MNGNGLWRAFQLPVSRLCELCGWWMVSAQNFLQFEYFSENGCLQKIKAISITARQPPIFRFGLRKPDDRATRWANFFQAATHLSCCGGPSNLKVQFLTHSRLVKGYLAFTYFIKYQYIGVPWDALDDLFWNFEYLTPVPFGRLLSADFPPPPKKIQVMSHIGHEEFWTINKYKGVK